MDDLMVSHQNAEHEWQYLKVELRKPNAKISLVIIYNSAAYFADISFEFEPDMIDLKAKTKTN